MHSEPLKWEGIAGQSLNLLLKFSIMHHFTASYMQWVFFVSQKNLPSERSNHDFWKLSNKKKAVTAVSVICFFLSFQLIWFPLCKVFRHRFKYFHNFTNLKQEQKPSHFVLSYLREEWGFIHKALWNGLSIIGISTELGHVLVMVLEKKTDNGAEIIWLAPCYFCEWTKEGVL